MAESREDILKEARQMFASLGGKARAKALTKAERKAAAFHAASAPRKKRKKKAA